MLTRIAATAQAYATGTRFMDRLVGDFTPADWAARDAAGHDPRWIVGHLAAIRHRVAALAGQPQPAAAWETSFARGTSPADLPAALDPAELLAAFHAADAVLASAWEGLTDEALDRPLGRAMPDGSDTVAGALAFLAWHEAYHMGQLGLLRRLAGKPGAA